MTTPVTSVANLAWRKSSHSNNGGNCVEVADLPGLMAVRDSKNPEGAVLTFEPVAWTAFVGAVKAGQFA